MRRKNELICLRPQDLCQIAQHDRFLGRTASAGNLMGRWHGSPTECANPNTGRVERWRGGFRIILFKACSAFTRVPACMVAKSPKSDPLHQSTSTHLLPPASPWLLSAERPIGRVGFAPTENRRLSRHTRIMARPRKLMSRRHA